jgi:peptidoglycan/LPS O-acetylase OafA/YrhL
MDLLERYPLAAAAYAVSIFIVLWLTAKAALQLKVVATNATPAEGRYGCIDGLRGFLAAGVFVSHSFTAYEYNVTGSWGWSASPILNQLGQTSVALFFMITGFLFTLRAERATVDWRALYLSRVLRIAPLYVLVVCAVFAIALSATGWVLRDTPAQLLSAIFEWMTFVVFGRPDINGLEKTWTIVAGVNWTLRYEVLFYVFAIPIIHFAARLLPLRPRLVGAVVLLAVLLFQHARTAAAGSDLLWAVHFLGGALVALAYRDPAASEVLKSRWFQYPAAGASIGLAFMLDAYNALGAVLSIGLFAAVVGGFSFFGLLRTKPALWLGDVSYGLYLLHGIALWLVLRALQPWLRDATLPQYFALVGCVGALVVGVASLSFIALEKPATRLRFGRRRMRTAALAAAPGLPP